MFCKTEGSGNFSAMAARDFLSMAMGPKRTEFPRRALHHLKFVQRLLPALFNPVQATKVDVRLEGKAAAKRAAGCLNQGGDPFHRRMAENFRPVQPAVICLDQRGFIEVVNDRPADFRLVISAALPQPGEFVQIFRGPLRQRKAHGPVLRRKDVAHD